MKKRPLLPSILFVLVALFPVLQTDNRGLHGQYGVVRGRKTPHRAYPTQRLHPCEQSSCYPATGNLLIGREKQLRASSTCGLERQERYCIVSHLEERKKCFWCDSRPQTRKNPHINHEISNIVYRFYPGTRQKSWWQSQNGQENVTIQLDLEAEFHFTHLIIVFKTFRPAAMLIERSYDFGRSWQVYRYFAHNCNESFPRVPKEVAKNLTDVVCESRYSNVDPSTNGEIIFRVLPQHVQIGNPYKQEVQNLLKMTNLRINFTKLHTLGDDLLDNRGEIQEKYYYAISDIVVRGSCSCYGHANRCLPLPGVEPKQDMVYGTCECTHNTKGRNCEECEDFYKDLPWKPAIGKQFNACKKCNCNNHATSCHFDSAVYQQSGRVSGGVCDGCQHHTMGTNCEMCKPYFYHEPGRDIQDPEACKPCDCDPYGSTDGGICDVRTDAYNRLEAGSCHCKKNVEGRRCDGCKNGFWNFTEENPEGCQSCTCNTLGTIDNQGCDVQNGECTCKRYVTGRDCHQCLPEYWGLSEKRDGCQPCDCDPGGSLDNSCDVVTGQCLCVDFLQGRRCNQAKQHHYVAAMDHYLYEAELARGSDNCLVITREPYRDGRESTWTGTGFMRVYENSDLDFTVNNIRRSQEYDIVIRYEPQLSGDWDEATIQVIRQEPVDTSGPCANSRPQDDIQRVTFNGGARSVVVQPPTCLEANKTYNIRIDFKRYQAGVDTPTSSILIDSIVLLPRIENIPFFHGSAMAESMLQEFSRNYCGQGYRDVIRGPVPEVCKKYHNSIGVYIVKGAPSCQCNGTGSVSKLCSEAGGNCPCKPHVVGRKCDRCAPGTYGFGPEGCKPCDCSGLGSLHNFCDAGNGQCKCNKNTFGRQCDQCQPGYWNYPKCQRCECNGYADTCDARTGACIKCRNSTLGHNCEQCKDGYYGDPRIGFAIPCRPCPCPESIISGHSYADRCSLDPQTKDVVCECREGYAGSQCDVCADNYFGYPNIKGGSCQECDCNRNVDITRPGNCDPHTGKCMQCLFDTEGDRCEHCKEGFYGDAIEQSCRECVCNGLGTDNMAGPCNRTTGQCPCLNNVIGLECGQCKPNHWRIALGQGCEPCDCDKVGSDSEQCNAYLGQCTCKSGFGGRQCNQCQANHWGDPNVECHTCDCDPRGSESLQCDRETGHCICRTGISGMKCDKCARGFLGMSPHCSPCGECFTNWDLILDERQEQTKTIIAAASKIKQTGAKGAYTYQFNAMSQTLDHVRNLLANTTVGKQDIEDIDKSLDTLRDDVNDTQLVVVEIDKKLNDVTKSIAVEKLNLNALQTQLDNLNQTAGDLRNNATNLQEANLELAVQLTEDYRQKVAKLRKTAAETDETLADAKRVCSAAEQYVERAKGDSNFDLNNQQLKNLEEEIDSLQGNISIVNEQICDSHGSTCDPLCGGAGCGKCGDSSACDEGAVMKIQKAMRIAQDTKEHIEKNELIAESLLRNLSQVNMEAQTANHRVEEAYRVAKAMNDTTGELLANIKDTIDDINSLNNATTPPENVHKIINETKSLEIGLEPSKIADLAQRIKNTVTSITDIDRILRETKNDIDLAKSLQAQAQTAKDNAEELLGRVTSVDQALNEAQDDQSKVEKAIQKANQDIATAETNLKQIEAQSSEAQVKSNDSVSTVSSLQSRLKPLLTSFLKNNWGAKDVKDKADKVIIEAEHAKEKARKLQKKYETANSTLAEKAQHSQNIRQRAQALFHRATTLTYTVYDKLKFIRELSSDTNGNEQQLKDLATAIDQLNNKMDSYLKDIRSRSSNYRSCAT